MRTRVLRRADMARHGDTILINGDRMVVTDRFTLSPELTVLRLNYRRDLTIPSEIVVIGSDEMVELL